MDDAQDKKPLRLAGRPLRLVASLFESAATRPLLFAAASKQLGLHRLQQLEIPRSVAPYRHHNLRPEDEPHD